MRVAVRQSHQRRCAPIQGKLVASATRFISTRPSCAESLKSFPAMTTRRGLLLGLGVIIAAPAIVGFENVMPERELAPELLEPSPKRAQRDFFGSWNDRPLAPFTHPAEVGMSFERPEVLAQRYASA